MARPNNTTTTPTTSRVFCGSEIGTLKRVIVHRPDEGIARISPKDAAELLFDDIVHLPNMQEEHDVFTAVLHAFLGKENVLEVQKLLAEALGSDEESKQRMIREIIDYEELPSSCKGLLQSLTDDELADVLISGYMEKEDYYMFDPIPNFIFTRDIAVCVNDHIVITKAARSARFRENFLARFIFSAHPIFQELRDNDRIINLNNVESFPPSKKGDFICIEGGDMMIINKDYLLIGCSERTNSYSIRLLKDALFEKKVIKNVVQVNIPPDRAYMHLDTIFTHINVNHTTAFKPIILEGLSSYVEVYRHTGSTTVYATLDEFLKAEINNKMKFILSGDGESPWQEREQWTDGCNLVALRPGVALTYDRNPKTEMAFKDYGYQVIHARTLLAAFADGSMKPEDIKNTIITLPSNELSRARGGSHCMTCPIERE
jgi:arginine deiminase